MTVRIAAHASQQGFVCAGAKEVTGIATASIQQHYQKTQAAAVLAARFLYIISTQV
jgi:hypothetical protein